MQPIPENEKGKDPKKKFEKLPVGKLKNSPQSADFFFIALMAAYIAVLGQYWYVCLKKNKFI